MIRLIRKIVGHFSKRAHVEILTHVPSEPVLTFIAYGHVNGSYSLAAYNRAYFKALDDSKSCKVFVQPVEGIETDDIKHVPQKYQKWLQKCLAKGSLPEVAANIYGHYPLIIPKNKNQINLVLFFWEESIIPENLIKTLNEHYDGALVATNFVKKILIDSGFEKNIKIIGSGLTFTPQSPKNISTDNEVFTFFHISSCFPRKGIDVLLKAYAQAFTRQDKVKLIVKGFPNPHNDLENLVHETFPDPTEAPLIEIINRDLSESELSLAYFQADTIVLPTRGEGLNLPAAEAMFCKKPMIVTDYSGHVDFCNSNNAWMIDYQYSFSQSHLKSNHSLWAEPNVGDLVKKMRELFEGSTSSAHKKNIEAKVFKAQKEANDFFNWSEVAKKTIEAYRDIVIAKKNKKKIKVGWLSPWENKCGIAEYSSFILNEFDKEQIDINVYSLSETENHPTNRNFNISSCAEINKSEKYLKSFIKKLIKDEINILVIQYNFNFFPISKFSSFIESLNEEKIKVVLVFHATKPLYTIKKHIFPKLKHCSRILVHTVNDMNHLKAYGLSQNTTYLPHGAINQLTEIKSANEIPTIAENRLTLGSYGFFMPHKGIFQLINAFKKILGSIPNARLILINAEYANRSSQEEIKRCMFHAKQLGIFHLIEWHTDFKPNSESLALIEKCDIMIFPYQKTEESSSAAVRMALASGKPVLTSPIAIFDDIRDITYRLKGIETQDITEGILNFLNLPKNEQQAMLDRQKHWLSDHDWKKISSRLQGMLKGLVNN